MTRDQLLQQTDDLSALLQALDKLIPGYVSADLLAFLKALPDAPVAADLLLSSLKLVQDSKARR